MKNAIIILILFITLQMSAQCWQSVSSGYDHSLAVKNDGTLWAWGYNSGGCLGFNESLENKRPQQIGTENDWLKVSSNFNSYYAIKTNGTLWAWGSNAYGQLGLGTASSSLVPTQVGTDTNWQSISCTQDFCIALKTDGTLWAWGRNTYGQLGDNTTVNKNSPVQIGTGTNWHSVSAGHYHSLAIKTDGTLWAWGFNYSGRLGDGTSTDRKVPVQIGTATNWQKVDAGLGHSLGIKTDGTLWGWGLNSAGEFGIVTNPTTFYSPIQIGTNTNWKEIVASYGSSYAIKTDNTFWSTGKNDFGQLGNGTNGTTNTFVFTQIGTSTNAAEIASGHYQALVRSLDGYISVTGRNNYGQLGDGTNTDKNTFTTIGCYPSVLSNEDFALNELKIYPNPVNDILNFSFDKEITAVSIYNLIGQEFLSKSVNNNQTSIDISNLSAGTYLVKVSSGNEVKTLKVVKN